MPIVSPTCLYGNVYDFPICRLRIVLGRAAYIARRSLRIRYLTHLCFYLRYRLLDLAWYYELFTPIANVAIKSRHALSPAPYRGVLQILSTFTRAIDRLSVVVWCDLSATFRTSRYHSGVLHYFRARNSSILVIRSRCEFNG